MKTAWQLDHVTLSPQQRERFVRAIASRKAMVAALEGGMSLAELQAQTWLVDIHPVEGGLVEHGDPLVDRQALVS